MHTLPGSSQFPTTRWTLVVAAGDPHRKEARSAIVSLCEDYWYPLYEFDGQQFDYVITVCDNARETCPVFFGKAEKLHRDFEDPAAVTGSEEQRLAVFRRVRDQLRAYLCDFSNGVA
ncbi:MAG: hypothetical protein JO061_18705 [Acidobacteriaceae bacterium]|nr:hypothetical protein [Acidobacteriaceae bacterium]